MYVQDDLSFNSSKAGIFNLGEGRIADVISWKSIVFKSIELCIGRRMVIHCEAGWDGDFIHITINESITLVS